MSELPPSPEAIAETERLATRTGAIDLHEMSLLGIFGSDDAPGALLRTRKGNILRVSEGDTVENMKIAAIGADSVTIERRGKRVELAMPGSDGASNSDGKGS